MHLDLNPLPSMLVLLMFVGMILTLGAGLLLRETLYDLRSLRGVLSLLATGVAVTTALVPAIFAFQVSHENAVKVQAAVHKTYGIELSVDDASDLISNNLSFTPGIADVPVKTQHNATTNIDTITYQQARLAFVKDGEAELVMVGAPFTRQYESPTEFKRAE
jgi:hypothetical protein